MAPSPVEDRPNGRKPHRQDSTQAEEALRQSEDRYRSLFDNMTEGFALHEIITDAEGRPADYRFLDLNPAFERLTGLKRVDLLGKRVLEALPGTESRWIENYGRVALTGEPAHFVEYSGLLSRWYEVFAYRPAPRQFAVLFTDISQRKQAEDQARKEQHETELANRIIGLFVEHEGVELFDEGLAVVQEFMASRHGVFGYLAEPGHLICPSLSKMLDACEIEGKCIHYPREKWKGLWARALTEKRSLFTNESPPVPRGHVIVHNNLAAPIVFRGESIGLLNLANKEGGYTEEDRQALDSVCNRIAPVLYAWIQRRLREEERQRAEEALRRSEGRWNAAIENFGEGVIIATEAEQVIYWNPAARRMHGFTNGNEGLGPLTETPLTFQLWTPDGDHLLALDEWPMRRIKRGETVGHLELRLRRPDQGWEKIVSYSGAMVETAGGERLIFLSVYDLTEQRRAEAALREREANMKAAAAIRVERQRFLDVLETLPVMICLLTADHHVSFANRGFRERFGEARGRHCHEYCFGRSEPCEFCESFTPFKTGQPHHWEVPECAAPDGSVIEFYAFPFTDSDGSPMILEMGINVTDQRRAEARVKAERQQLFDVLETLPVYVILLTEDYRVPFANRYFEERFGKSEGRKCYQYLFHRTEPCENCETFKVFQTDQPHHWFWTGPDQRDYDIFDFPFSDTDGSRMIMEMGIDVTDRNAAVKELNKAHSDLEARAAQLRALAGELTLAEQRERRRIAKVLHDHLQQMLVGARYRVTHLGRLGDERVRAGAKEIEELLNDCVTASRSLTAELSPPILHEAGLNAGLQWLCRWMADKQGLFVELNLEETEATLAEDVKLLLFELVRELLFNAVKHSQTLAAAVTVRLVAGQVQVVVSDEGEGFDPSALPPAGDKGGFGLFSIRERLGLIGGKLEIDSAPGRGSRFTLTLPIMGLPPAASPTPPAAGESFGDGRTTGGTQAPAIEKIRVLIADDHAVMREGLNRLLEGEPDLQIVGLAADGQEAVDLAETLLPDVILMDFSMPRLNGVEATRLIHNAHPEIRIIGLSMFEEAERAEALLNAGAVAYLTKSGQSGNLIATIREVAGKSPNSGAMIA